ncbi:MAG: choice-of-anchor L domain-containing protein [Bacteroidetes bacterium]|nr:choice-of-anchor L domain-containing protein [Bacteroidota bacterium]
MKFFIMVFCALLVGGISNAQLVITDEPSALALAQRLVGDGVTISNVSFTGNTLMAGKFRNTGNFTHINLDSGIVLTDGRAKTIDIDNIGTNGDGVTAASDVTASTMWGLPGDQDLANAIGADVTDLNDACVLEFDFVPSGDTIRFRYVFSSEEYFPGYVCTYNDAFGFFISGPGITGIRNIALVPNTTTPVSIFNVNNVTDPPANCVSNPLLYYDNTNNKYFTHDGHTVVLTAISNVTPCQTYHLKLVVSDFQDDALDTGVFLEAKSLSSNIVTLTNNTQTDTQNNSYIVEGCVTGSFTISRPHAADYPLNVQLTYGGTAVNGVDVQTLPATVTIPAYDSVVTVNVIPIIDNIPEGIEFVKVYAGAGCASTVPIDSTIIQIRDYDTLTILPAHSAYICKNGSITLHASAAWSTFLWDAVPGLNNYAISDPVATPLQSGTTYICTASVGTCHGRDSVILSWRDIEFNSQLNINCQGASTGQIVVSGGPEWTNAPVQYHIDNLPVQTSGTFNNLPVGNYMVHISDGSGCSDSIPVNLVQAWPNLVVDDTEMEPASCTSQDDGLITVSISGGKAPYRYSINGTTYQNSNQFHVGAGTYTISVLDANNCSLEIPGVAVPFIDGLTLNTGADLVICESNSVVLPATSNAASVHWSVAGTQPVALNSTSTLNPTANPVVTTQYYIDATLGVCTKRDSVKVIVNPAPVPDAGPDVTVCNGGITSLSGSGGVSYLWHPANYLSDATSNNPTVTEATSTTYYLDVVDANGCHSLRSDAMNLTVLPPAELYAGHDTVVAMNQPLQMAAIDINHVGFIHYEWSPATGLNNPYDHHPVAVLNAANTDFIVTAYTADHCIGKDTVNVKTYLGPEIYVAGSFTPNSDGINDVLKARPVGIREFRYFTIYNRFGQMVFSTPDPNRGWDGKYLGATQNMGTYVWIAAGVDYKGHIIERKGTVTIIQ